MDRSPAERAGSVANKQRRGRRNLPWWLVALLVVVTVLAASALFWIEDGVSFRPTTVTGWVLLVIAIAPLYLILEMGAEACAEGLQSDHRFMVRAIPIGIVVLLYVLWYAIR